MWYNQIGLGLEHGLWGRKSPPLEKQNSPCFCSRVEWHRRGRLRYLSFLSQSVNHFLTLASNHKLLGLSSWFSFCAWPWIQPHMFTKSKWGGAFTPVLVVFYQLISNTWSHANPLTPLAVSAHTNRNKHTETHYINCLFSPALIILQCVPSPLFFQLQFSLVFATSHHHLSDLCTSFSVILSIFTVLSMRRSYLFSDNPISLYLSAPLITSIPTAALGLCAELRFGKQIVSSQRRTGQEGASLINLLERRPEHPKSRTQCVYINI